MQARAVRCYGANDVRLETIDLPDIAHDQIRAKIVTDSMCMSTYKFVTMGQKHKRAPRDLAHNPAVIGHEMCGVIEQVGEKWRDKYHPGDRFIMQTAMLYDDNLLSAGFSFPYFGGNATYINIPNEVMERDYVIPYHADAYYLGSLGEPMACIAAAFHASYHVDQRTYAHEMGIKKGGKLALLASAGPMGIGAIDYALACEDKPSLLVVTDVNHERLLRARHMFPTKRAKELGVELVFVNTKDMVYPVADLRGKSGGFDDVFVMAPVETVITQADQLLARDGCLNFFAGPTDTALTARVNFFNVHYASTHFVGTTGSRLCDLKEVVRMMDAGALNPTGMITHVGGLNSVPDAVLRFPDISGGKKLIYNHIDMPLTAIVDFAERGKVDPTFARLAEITADNRGMWCPEAERFLLEQLG